MNPWLGVFLHALGGLAAGSFYIPFKKVRGWAWESYWLASGVAAWLAAPWIVALITVPGLWDALRGAPSSLHSSPSGALSLRAGRGAPEPSTRRARTDGSRVENNPPTG